MPEHCHDQVRTVLVFRLYADEGYLWTVTCRRRNSLFYFVATKDLANTALSIANSYAMHSIDAKLGPSHTKICIML